MQQPGEVWTHLISEGYYFQDGMTMDEAQDLCFRMNCGQEVMFLTGEQGILFIKLSRDYEYLSKILERFNFAEYKNKLFLYYVHVYDPAHWVPLD